jgi:hypothetical protein
METIIVTLIVGYVMYSLILKPQQEDLKRFKEWSLQDRFADEAFWRLYSWQNQHPKGFVNKKLYRSYRFLRSKSDELLESYVST